MNLLVFQDYSCWNDDIKENDFLVSLPLNILPNFLFNTVLFTWKPELKSRQIGSSPLTTSFIQLPVKVRKCLLCSHLGCKSRWFSNSSLYKSAGCPGTYFIEPGWTPTSLCLLSIGVKGVCHHCLASNF